MWLHQQNPRGNKEVISVNYGLRTSKLSERNDIKRDDKMRYDICIFNFLKIP